MSIIRCKFTKEEDMIYISHLDLLRLFDKAIRRARIRIAFSQGFNPHPKISFGHALSLGMASNCEYVDIELEEELNENEFLDRINKALPKGVQFVNAIFIDKSDPSLISIITHAKYNISLKINDDLSIDDIKNKVNEFLNLNEIINLKKNKKGKINEINIRPLIEDMKVIKLDNNIVTIEAILVNSSSENLKATTLVSKLKDICNLDIDDDYFNIKRVDFYIKEGSVFKRPI